MIALQGNFSNFNATAFKLAIASLTGISPSRIIVMNVTNGNLIVITFEITDASTPSEPSASTAANMLYNDVSDNGFESVSISSFHVVALTVYGSSQQSSPTTSTSATIIETVDKGNSISSTLLMNIIIALAVVLGCLIMVCVGATLLARRKFQVANTYNEDSMLKRYQTVFWWGE